MTLTNKWYLKCLQNIHTVYLHCFAHDFIVHVNVKILFNFYFFKSIKYKESERMATSFLDFIFSLSNDIKQQSSLHLFS